MNIRDSFNSFISELTPQQITFWRGMAIIVIAMLAIASAVTFARWLSGRNGTKIPKQRISQKKNGLKKRINRRLAEGVIFGSLCFKLYTSPGRVEGSVVAIGGSGSSKTSGILIPSLRYWRGNALVFDISGDIEKNVLTPSKVVIAPYGAGNGSKTAYWDVFAIIDAAGSDSDKYTLLAELAYLLMPKKENEDTDGGYFYRQARAIFEAALYAYYFHGLDFAEICKQLLSMDIDLFLRDIEASGNEKAIMRLSSTGGIKQETQEAIKQELDEHLNLFAINDRVSNVLRRGGVSPANLEHQSIYVNIPEDKLAVLAPMMKVITAQCFHYLSGRVVGKNSPPLLLCLDEFARIGKLDNILETLRTVRKRRCRLLILTQSLSDLALVYPKEEARAMLDNLPFKVVLQADEVETRKYFSELAGEVTVKTIVETEQSQDGVATGQKSKQIREERRKMLQPEDFRNLLKYLILFYPGGVILLKKYQYFKFFRNRSYLRRAKKQMNRYTWEDFKRDLRDEREERVRERKLRRGELVRAYDADGNIGVIMAPEEAERIRKEREDRELAKCWEEWKKEQQRTAAHTLKLKKS